MPQDDSRGLYGGVSRIGAMNTKLFIYIALLTGLLTYVLYQYHRSQPPSQEQIERCNERASKMPERTEEEINKNINTFLDCLSE